MIPVLRSNNVFDHAIDGPTLMGGGRNSKKLTVSERSPPKTMPTADIGSSMIGKLKRQPYLPMLRPTRGLVVAPAGAGGFADVGHGPVAVVGCVVTGVTGLVVLLSAA